MAKRNKDSVFSKMKSDEILENIKKTNLINSLSIPQHILSKISQFADEGVRSSMFFDF